MHIIFLKFVHNLDHFTVTNMTLSRSLKQKQPVKNHHAAKNFKAASKAANAARKNQMPNTKVQTKDYCFTVFGKDDAQLVPDGHDSIYSMSTEFSIERTPKFDPTTMHYLVYQKETCPTSGRRHLQGFVQFTTRHRIQGAQAALGLPKDVHMESRRGSAVDASNYCKKCSKHEKYLGDCPQCTDNGERIVVHGELQETVRVSMNNDDYYVTPIRANFIEYLCNPYEN